MGFGDFVKNPVQSIVGVFTDDDNNESAGNLARTTQLASDVIQAVGQRQGGLEQKRAARREAEQIRTAARQEASNRRRASQQLIGTQRAVLGASGFEAIGTPALLTLDTLLTGIEEEKRILTGADKAAFNVARRGRRAGLAQSRAAIGTILTGVGRAIS